MDLRSLQDNIEIRLMSAEIIRTLFDGKLSLNQYQIYMSDVYCYALHSSQVIALAGTRLVLSHPPLAEYLFHHASEELGHDKWAASDLQDLGLSAADIRNVAPSSPCARMIGLEYYYAAHANPVGLFGWMFVLESLGGKVGGKIAQAIDQTLKLDGKGIYFLRGHGEADAHHSEDLYRVISENVKSQEDRDAFLFMARESEDLYCAILDNALNA